MEDLYSLHQHCQLCIGLLADGVQSDWFPFSTGADRQGCNMAPDLFLEAMDWIMDRTVHRGFAGISIGSQGFTDLARLRRRCCCTPRDDGNFASLAYEARPLGLEINWDKTKIQGSDPNTANPTSVFSIILSWATPLSW